MGSGTSSEQKSGKYTMYNNEVNHASVMARYVREYTLREGSSRDELEFRILLDDTIGFSYLKNWALPSQLENLQSLKQLLLEQKRSWTFRRIMATLGGNNSNEDAGINHLAKKHRPTFAACFDLLFVDLFLRFKESQCYINMYEEIAESKNILPGDFDYYTKLGSGAFGSVFSCRHRSTGIMYAMKVQPKAALLRNTRGNLDEVMMELRASTGIPSPFVCQAQYAFQTSKLVFLALPLYSGGDLRRALNVEPSGHFLRPRAQFYAAELASTLMYLHSSGLIHRDLKPENIFIGGNGHLVLGDLGSMLDGANSLVQRVRKTAFSNSQNFMSSLQSGGFDSSRASVDFSLPSQSFSAYIINETPGGTSTEAASTSAHMCSYSYGSRGNGIVGTLRYMSPEVLALFADQEARELCPECTPALDWYSFGVIVHEMLTGKYPFYPARSLTYKMISSVYPTYIRKYDYDAERVHSLVMGPFTESEDTRTLLGDSGRSIVTGLVERNPALRIGINCKIFSEMDVYSELKSHEFFEGIDWDVVSNQLMAPVVSEGGLSLVQVNTTTPQTLDFMLTADRKRLWVDGEFGECRSPAEAKAAKTLLLTDDEQVFFKSWNFSASLH